MTPPSFDGIIGSRRIESEFLLKRFTSRRDTVKVIARASGRSMNEHARKERNREQSVLHGSNKKKMREGGRGRASLGVKVWNSRQMWTHSGPPFTPFVWLDTVYSFYACVRGDNTVRPFYLQLISSDLKNLRSTFPVLVVLTDHLTTLDAPRARACELSISRMLHMGEISVICAVGDACCGVETRVVPFPNELGIRGSTAAEKCCREYCKNERSSDW